MDIVLDYCDENFFTPYVYPATWQENDILRQFISLMVVFTISGYLLYFATATFSYYFVFDKRLMSHPLILENQVWKEIKVATSGLLPMSLLSVACFLLEIRGYSQLLDSVDQSSLGWASIPISIVSFIVFTDCLIYWIHRGLHHPWAYKRLHKMHHLWKVPTPFASHAFHPIDGFLQSSPYHIYVFLFPMNKLLYLAMFFMVNFWTVSIHDGDYRVPKLLESVVNGAAHHTDHHLYYNFNYGQFFTLWDRIGGTFRYPSSFQGDSPLSKVLREQIGSKVK